MAVDRVLGVEDGGDLFGDGLQLVQADPAFLVDEEAHEMAAPLTLDLDVHELEAAVGGHARGDGLHPLNRPTLPRQFSLQKKEWASPLWSSARCQKGKCSRDWGSVARIPRRSSALKHAHRIEEGR